VKILSFSSFSFLLLLFTFSAFAKDCEDIKKSLLVDSQISAEDKVTFNKGIESQDSCYLNLMGTFLYEGKFFDKDQTKAEEIFYALSNKDYPEAQFNFAWTMTKKDDQNPNDVINLLLGIHHKYLNNKKKIHLSSKARDLGRLYLAELPNKIYNCKYPISKFTLASVEEMKVNFEENIKASTLNYIDLLEKRTAELKENTDTIFALLSLGVMAYSISPGYTSSAPQPPGAYPWINYRQGYGSVPLFSK
jgi:hypothetical protein